MVSAPKAETQERQSCHEEWKGEPIHDQASLGVESAIVALSVETSSLVVQPVADDLCDDGGDDGSEEEESCIDVSDASSQVTTRITRTYLLWAKVVEWSYEEGESGIDGNDPSESASVVEIRDEDHRVRNRLEGSAYCLPEGIAQVPRSPLLDSDQAEEPRTSRHLL